MSLAVDPLSRVLGGRFQLVRRLGAGAFGTVYEAEDVDHKQRIAVKQLHVLDGDALYRFKQEFRSAADIAHPNVVGLKELFSVDGHWYITMEFIDGVDFRTWIRGDAPELPLFLDSEQTKRWKTDEPPDVITASYAAAYDEERLRSSLAQLAEAVHALHRHHVLHRDLKPSNVMIARDARLRVLDYGLAAPLGREGLHTTLDDIVVGTPGYMSPEQAEGLAIAPASDWYSVGAMLFEALAGKLPFDGPAREVLWRKVHEDGPDPRIHDRDLPSDLAELCHALLRREPAERPTFGEVISVVGRTRTRAQVPAFAGETVFVGRTSELATLKQAAQRAATGGVVVHVQGPSGVGKSALVRRFVEEIERDAVVLAGRCFERESVPFKALDSLVDALTQHLRGLPKAESDALVPEHAGALTRVFPVLSRVDSFAGARLAPGLDPNEIRRRAASALRELLGRLAKKRPLVVWIDDLQWGDADSAVLFRELVAPPDPPAMLMVLGYRIEDAAAEMVAAVRGRRSVDHWVELAIQPLGSTDTELLASTLLGPNSNEARRVASESGGVPFFVHELARTVTSGISVDNLSLDKVLAQRIEALPERARRLLDVVAASGGPITLRVARVASEGALDELILLRAARFVRSRGDGDDDFVECFHDRIRETARAHIADRVAIHRAIAEALEHEPVLDPEAIVVQYRAAGDDAQTLRYAERAAELAAHKLAFDRAVDLYALALDLAPADRRQHFRVRHAEALANAGRGAAAAAAFRDAADGTTGDESVRLRTRSAEQFLRSGLVDEGIAQLQPALHHLALRLPGSPRSALVTLLARRAQLKLRGLAFTERKADALPATDLHRIDLCWSVGNGLGGVDMVRAATFQSKHLLLALAAGEPYRVSRAIAWESIVRSMEGGANGRRRAGELAASAKAIADRIAHPHARAWAAATLAIAADCEGRWCDAIDHSTTTIALFREAQTDVAWEVGSMYAWWLLPAHYMSGQLGELAYRAPQAVSDAEAVGDLYTATSLRTYVTPRLHLVHGDPDRADAERADAIGKWSRAGWHLQHWCDVHARCEIALYRGDGKAALASWEAARAPLAASLLMRMCMIGTQTRYSLGRAAVLAGSPADLDRAAKCARELANLDTGWANEFAHTLEAGIAMRRGDRARALEMLAAAAAGYRVLDMLLHMNACDLIRGRLADAPLAATAETWLRAHEVADPDALAGTLVPGFRIDN